MANKNQLNITIWDLCALSPHHHHHQRRCGDSIRLRAREMKRKIGSNAKKNRVKREISCKIYTLFCPNNNNKTWQKWDWIVNLNFFSPFIQMNRANFMISLFRHHHLHIRRGAIISVFPFNSRVLQIRKVKKLVVDNDKMILAMIKAEKSTQA